MKKKPIVMQHIVEEYINNGGPATGYKLLMASDLKDKYDFVPLIQKQGTGFNLRLLIDMVKQIRKTKPDLIHIRGLQSEGFYGLLASRLAGVKNTVVSVHGTYSGATKMRFLKKIVFEKIIEPQTLKYARLVYCVCEYATKRPIIYNNATNLYGYIHNAAPEISQIDPELTTSRIKKEFGIKENEIVVVSVGRIEFDKGLADLISAIKIIGSKFKVRYLIVGEGNYVPEFKNKLFAEIQNRKVILLGKRADVYDILLSGDIFVFPSLHENLSNALLEACAAGLAVIATNVGGNPEIVKHLETGILIPPNDSDALAKEINRLCENHSFRKELGHNARLFMQNNFNQQKIFNQLNEVYSSLINT